MGIRTRNLEEWMTMADRVPVTGSSDLTLSGDSSGTSPLIAPFDCRVRAFGIAEDSGATVGTDIELTLESGSTQVSQAALFQHGDPVGQTYTLPSNGVAIARGAEIHLAISSSITGTTQIQFWVVFERTGPIGGGAIL